MNPYRTKRERDAWEAGRAFGRNERPSEDGEPKLLTIAEMRAMSPQQINERWPEVARGLVANKRGDEDE